MGTKEWEAINKLGMSPDVIFDASAEQRGYPLVEEMTKPVERLDRTALFKLPLTGGIVLTTLFSAYAPSPHHHPASPPTLLRPPRRAVFMFLIFKARCS
jgi:hypothetical protein